MSVGSSHSEEAVFCFLFFSYFSVNLCYFLGFDFYLLEKSGAPAALLHLSLESFIPDSRRIKGAHYGRPSSFSWFQVALVVSKGK